MGILLLNRTSNYFFRTIKPFLFLQIRLLLRLLSSIITIIVIIRAIFFIKIIIFKLMCEKFTFFRIRSKFKSDAFFRLLLRILTLRNNFSNQSSPLIFLFSSISIVILNFHSFHISLLFHSILNWRTKILNRSFTLIFPSSEQARFYFRRGSNTIISKFFLRNTWRE